MPWELILYAAFTFISLFALTSVNFNNVFKAEKGAEAKMLIILLSISIGYLVTNFVLKFLNLNIN